MFRASSKQRPLKGEGGFTDLDDDTIVAYFKKWFCSFLVSFVGWTINFHIVLLTYISYFPPPECVDFCSIVVRE